MSSSNFSLSVSSIVNISKPSSLFFLNISLFLFSEASKAEITRDSLLLNFFVGGSLDIRKCKRAARRPISEKLPNQPFFSFFLFVF